MSRLGVDVRHGVGGGGGHELEGAAVGVFEAEVAGADSCWSKRSLRPESQRDMMINN